MLFVWLIGILVVIDLSLKTEIESSDEKEFPRKLGRKGKVVLHKSHNYGLPFGFLKERREAVKMIPVVTASAVGGVLLWLLQKKGNLTEKLGFSLVFAGALSNLYDRAIRHYVVDYISFDFGKLKKVIFNLGDICIILGSLILMVREMAGDRDSRRK